jgi:uncharacterized repeat protein (TIGR01451 family)
MRSFHAIVGMVALGAGVAGWATLGQAQPKPARPVKVEVPSPRPKPVDDPFVEPIPAVRTAKPETESASGPVRVLDKDAVDVPDLPPAPGKPAAKPAAKPALAAPSPEPPDPKAAGPAAREEPAVSLEWVGPTTLKVGAPAEYTVVARNMCAIPLHKVIVQVKVPAGAKVVGTEPKAQGTDAVLMWDLGTLAPRQETPVKLRLVPPARGEMVCQAWVTFTGSTALKVQVREPKLEVAVRVPEKATVGDPVTVLAAVSNPGDHAADAVKVVAALGAGLEGPHGTKEVIEVGTLAAGETREVKVPCVARAAGVHKCDLTAEGDTSLKAVGAATVLIVQPKLELEVAGPKLRYLDRKAVYSVKVSNPGDAPATEVVISHVVPAGFKFAAADAGGRYDAASRSIQWIVGEVSPGQAKELKCELVASGTGDFTHAVAAAGARGVKAEKSIATKVEGLSALGMEVADSDDPVEVGSDTTYEIRVTNTGSKDETDVKVVCTIPQQMKFKAADGPGRFEVTGAEVVFDPVKRLPAHGDVIYKVTVTAKIKGDARFKATLTAGGLTEPVIRQESTRVYSD